MPASTSTMYTAEVLRCCEDSLTGVHKKINHKGHQEHKEMTFVDSILCVLLVIFVRFVVAFRRGCGPPRRALGVLCGSQNKKGRRKPEPHQTHANGCCCRSCLALRRSDDAPALGQWSRRRRLRRGFERYAGRPRSRRLWGDCLISASEILRCWFFLLERRATILGGSLQYWVARVAVAMRSISPYGNEA